MYALKRYGLILSVSFIAILSYFIYDNIHPLLQETNTIPTITHPLITCRKVDVHFEPVEPTAVFYIDSPEIHSLLSFENLPNQSILLAKWFYGTQDQTPLHETSMNVSGSDKAHFWIQSPSKGWYIGNYFIVIYLNGELIETKEFIVTYK